jgi:uncharacterized membrane-anchored protein
MGNLAFLSTQRTRHTVLISMSIIILLLINSQIFIKERIVQEGQTLLLRLLPRDPRSLLQGDYMALRYAMTDKVAQAATKADVKDGHIVVQVEPSGEALFIDLYHGQSLAEKQHLLRFRKRGQSVRLASDAFFFQEGQWRHYEQARYGQLRVDTHGEAVLTGLFDANFKQLGAP